MKASAPLVVCAVLFARLVAGAPSAADTQFFAEKVAPLLEQRCYECHSHKSGKMKGGLTLDSRSGWATGGELGPVIVPGELEKSPLITAIRHSDPDLKMPKEKLPPAEIAVLEEWVKRGAPDPRETAPVAATAPAKSDDWWSLKALVRPAVPTGGSAQSSVLSPQSSTSGAHAEKLSTGH
jgi:hypothetical protein